MGTRRPQTSLENAQKESAQTRQKQPWEARLLDQLANVAATIGSRQWDLQTLDRDFRTALILSLDQIKAVGIIAHFPTQEVTLSCFTPRSRVDRKRGAEIAGHVTEILTANATVFEREGSYRFNVKGYTVVAIRIRTRALRHATRRWDICALLYKSIQNEDLEEERVQRFHACSTLALLYPAMKNRVTAFAPFAGQISQWYWDEQCWPPVPPGKPLSPPWTLQKAVRTATLCFDLRKSTFCMEQADSPTGFAIWLDQLGQILTRVCHRHGGVFERFTGDGAPVHFLENECQAVYGKGAELLALACAVDMQRALDYHLERLKRLLRFKSQWLGAGIGIDVAKAFWKIDHRGNPITVGKGIVGASRICEVTSAKRISLTNIAYQRLRALTRADRALRQALWDNPDLQEEPFASKEFKDDMKIQIWQFQKLPDVFGWGRDSINKLCDEVYAHSAQCSS
jgi:class 3 adenylate cyclase